MEIIIDVEITKKVSEMWKQKSQFNNIDSNLKECEEQLDEIKTKLEDIKI